MENGQLQQQTIDTVAIIQSLVKGFNATDRHDHALRRSLWTDELVIDFGDVKETQQVKADDLAEWARIAYKDMTTMHMSFNHEVSVHGDRATVHSYGRALHKQQVSKGADYWFIYARYEHELVKEGGVWKVCRIRMEPVYQEGNTNLVNQAYADAMEKQA